MTNGHGRHGQDQHDLPAQPGDHHQGHHTGHQQSKANNNRGHIWVNRNGRKLEYTD